VKSLYLIILISLILSACQANKSLSNSILKTTSSPVETIPTPPITTTPTPSPTVTVTPETTEQRLYRIAEAESAAGAVSNDFFTWGKSKSIAEFRSPEGHTLKEIADNPDIMSDSEIMTLHDYMLDMRTHEYDALIDQSPEGLRLMKVVAWNAIAGIENNIMKANEMVGITFENRQDFKTYLQTLSQPQKMYLEVVRRAMNAEVIYLTPYEKAQVNYDANYVLAHEEWKNLKLTGYGKYGFFDIKADSRPWCINRKVGAIRHRIDRVRQLCKFAAYPDGSFC
jgi:hypothetical protein